MLLPLVDEEERALLADVEDETHLEDLCQAMRVWGRGIFSSIGFPCGVCTHGDPRPSSYEQPPPPPPVEEMEVDYQRERAAGNEAWQKALDILGVRFVDDVASNTSITSEEREAAGHLRRAMAHYQDQPPPFFFLLRWWLSPPRMDSPRCAPSRIWDPSGGCDGWP